jgi:putative CocE/NonD family hydrolase
LGKLIAAVAVALSMAPGAASAQEYGPHRVAEVVPFAVTAEGGDVLRGHVYLPDAPGPYATVLELSPYHDTTSGSPTAEKAPGGEMTELFKPFTEAGYAVAFVSMRGTGKSDGCLPLGGYEDRRDAYAVIESLADQPWSNGRIGMWGLSYAGWSQYLAMAAKPPSLKAVVPESGVIDLWSLISRRGAAFQVAGPAFAPAWSALTSLSALDPVVDATEHAPCPNLATDSAEDLMLQFGTSRNAWWDERDMRPAIKGSRIPALITNGMSMLRMPATDQEGHILQFRGLWDLLRPDRTRMLLGQWPHAYPYNNGRPDFTQMTLDFFDEHLRGADRKLKPGVVEYQDDDKTWHTARSWPPPAQTKRLYLSGEAVTDDPLAITPAQRIFQSADHDPGLRVQPTAAEDGKPYLSPCGPTQALFVSPPLAEDVHVAGEFDVDVTVSSTLPGGHFSFFIHRTSGTATCPDDKALDTGRAMLDLQHYRVDGQAEPFPIGVPTRVRFHSHPLAANLKKGERIVVAIGGGASELTVDQLAPLLTVHTGPGIPASFTVPVESGELRFTR